MIHVAKLEDADSVTAYCGLVIELQENGDTVPPHADDFVLYPDGPTAPTCDKCMNRSASEFKRRWGCR